jgi:RimJ/RimL family protein N-acetyltransferase
VNDRDPLPLTTPRLILRPFRLDDVATLHAYRSDPVARRFQGWGDWTFERSERFVAAVSASPPLQRGGWGQIALELRAPDGALAGHIGDLGVHLDGAGRQAEIGVTLAPAARGRGYASEGLDALLALLFGDLGLHRVTALTDADNRDVMRLLARLGFRREAHYVESFDDGGVWRDEFAFALLARTWRASGERERGGVG